jgi:trimeric autotransporter adhesin
MTFTRRSLNRGAAIVAALGLTVGMTLTTAPAAQSSNAFIATPNGMVGLTQEVVVRTPNNLRNQPVTIGFTSGPYATSLQTVINAQGFGSVSWTPSQAGTWTIAGLGNAVSVGSTTVNVAAMPTTTILMVPNNVQQGVSSNIVAVVSAPLGTVAPAGSVTVRAGGSLNVVGQGSLTPLAGSSRSVATIAWTPPAGGDFPLIGTYTPSSSAFAGSTSPVSQPNITTTRPTVALRFPPSLYVGQQTVLSAVLGNGVADGSVAYLLNGVGISGSMPTVNGVESFQWTPTVGGVQTITVNFSGPLNISGSSSQAVNILPAPPADGISVSPQGGGAWSVGAPIVVRAGSNTLINASSTSGATVVLSETGPCVLNGAIMTALSAGQCTLTATSPGSASFLPNTANYTITVQAPPRRPRR